MENTTLQDIIDTLQGYLQENHEGFAQLLKQLLQGATGIPSNAYAPTWHELRLIELTLKHLSNKQDAKYLLQNLFHL